MGQTSLIMKTSILGSIGMEILMAMGSTSG
jgi:hypothetical protein